MNRIIVAVGMATMFAGCAFNPESMPVGDKDSAVYVDAGAPKNLFASESKAKVAVITSVGEYTAYKSVGETLDSSLNAKLGGFSFFQVVDRKSQAALIKDSMIAGADPSEIVNGIEADFVVVARIASLVASVGLMSSNDATFDFKWIDKSTQRVIMTESIKPSVRSAQTQADLFVALNRAAEVAAREFCAKIAVKYAPPARVLQTRGNGAVARISIGKNYGVSEGTKVCFFEIIDNSDVGGEKRDQNDIATGTVKRVEAKTAWVEVDNADNVNVRKGVYVRVLETTKGMLDNLQENIGLSN